LEPHARALFGFSPSEDIKENDMYDTHALSMVHMIDNAVFFLGGDLAPIKDDLQRLGKRHIRYNVNPEFLPTMEVAVLFAMDELLGEEFTKQDRASWQVIFYFMVMMMQAGMKTGNPK
jgi:hemoglobin-like flavoprotein